MRRPLVNPKDENSRWLGGAGAVIARYPTAPDQPIHSCPAVWDLELLDQSFLTVPGATLMEPSPKRSQLAGNGCFFPPQPGGSTVS